MWLSVEQINNEASPEHEPALHPSLIGEQSEDSQPAAAAAVQGHAPVTTAEHGLLRYFAIFGMVAPDYHVVAHGRGVL